MGLAERRAQKAFETDKYPHLLEQVRSAAGVPVEIDVKWDTLAKEGEAHLYGESWEKVYFTPLVAAFKDVCRDQMGKDAVKSTLKKIVVQNTQGHYYGDRWATFAGGVLTLDHEPHTNVDNVDERTKGLIAVLEKGL
jgi:hypothetical protein